MLNMLLTTTITSSMLLLANLLQASPIAPRQESPKHFVTMCTGDNFSGECTRPLIEEYVCQGNFLGDIRSVLNPPDQSIMVQFYFGMSCTDRYRAAAPVEYPGDAYVDEEITHAWTYMLIRKA